MKYKTLNIEFEKNSQIRLVINEHLIKWIQNNIFTYYVSYLINKKTVTLYHLTTDEKKLLSMLILPRCHMTSV